MLWTLIKNNLKMMLRCKWRLGIVVIGPILVIAALSSAFHNMLETNEALDCFKIGYLITEDCRYTYIMETVQQAEKDSEIEWISYGGSKGAVDSKNEIEDGTVAVFVVLDNTSYSVYADEEHDIQAKLVEYTMYQLFHGQNCGIEFPAVSTKFTKTPTAINYYGKIEIVYFLWCSMILLSTVVNSERKDRISQRFKVAPVSNITLYFAKLIPCFLAIVAANGAAFVIATTIFDIKWRCLFQTILILLLAAGAVSTSAVVFFHLSVKER